MTELQLLDIRNNETPLLKDKAVEPKKDKKDSNSTVEPDALLLAYMEIRKSVELDYNTAVVHAKVLEANTVAQDSLIMKEQKLNFYQLRQSQFFTKKSTWAIKWSKGNLYIKQWTYKVKKSIKASVLQNLELKNQEIAAVRNGLQDSLTVLKQDNQIGETDLNSVMNETTNSVQQGSSIMQMLNSLTQVISRI